MEDPTTLVVGVGRLTWPRYERVSDRYGLVALMHDGDSFSASVDWVKLEIPAEGARGTLRAVVLETRDSTHIGDLSRGIRPETPEQGEEITLGTGRVFSEAIPGEKALAIGLRPEGDDRTSDWLDPRALYRAHEQTVRLVFVPQ